MEVDQTELQENKSGNQSNGESTTVIEKNEENQVKDDLKNHDGVSLQKLIVTEELITTIEEESNGNQEDPSKNEKNPKENKTDSSYEKESSEKCTNESSSLEKLSEKEAEETLECIDVEMESQNNKNNINDKNQELENTEFVQFNQDKEESQTEIQSEAVDPFGGDSLNINTDSNELMEVDSSRKAEKTKSTEIKDKSKDSKNIQDNEDKEQPTDKTDLKFGKESNVKEQQTDSSKETMDIEQTISPKKNSDKSMEISEKDDESTEVLPGQDNELCIIPDSTKENKASDKDKTDQKKVAAKENEVVIENDCDTDNQDKEKSKEKGESESQDKSKENSLKVAVLTSKTNEVQENTEKSTEGQSVVTSDVIDIEDDAKNSEIEEIDSKEICKQCKEEKTCSIKVKVGSKTFNVCSEACKTAFSNDNNKATDIPSEGVSSKRDKRCANCLLIVEPKDERSLSWETMEFCNEECLGKFQTRYGSYCRNCNGAVQAVSLGKYCVRFGYDVRQFCCSTCLEEFKKGLKVCSYCQKDISAGAEGFLAPVGDKGQFKDFCTQDCMEKYSKMNSTEPPVPEKKVCSVCQEEKVMFCEVQIDRNPSVAICSEPCFAAFKFVNKVDPDQCSTCKKYFQLPTKKGRVVFYEDEAHAFCNKTCLNVFIITNRKIVPCNWCKVKKYNFDMIKKELKTGQVMMMCSLNCLTLYQVSVNAVSARRINCDFCKEFSQAQYHLTMSDATIRNFCSYKCVMNFQAQYTKSPITIPAGDANGPSDPVPTGIPKRAIAPASLPRPLQPSTVNEIPATSQIAAKKTLPVISSVTSLAAIANGQAQNTVQLGNAQTGISAPITLQGTTPVIYKQQVITRPTSPVEIGNKMTQCKPQMHTKGVSVRPIPCDQSTQTEGLERVIVPIPVPIYVPFPAHMYSMPFPVPVPIPLPIPVPIFIPTTRNSVKGILKEIKKIQEKIPSDPFEAELLMMAEMVATEKKNDSDSDSNDEASRENAEVNDEPQADNYSPEGVDGGVDSSNTFGEDMLQMALKMADELEEPAVDLETALTSNTIQTPARAQNEENAENNAPTPRVHSVHSSRGRKRGSSYKTRGVPSKRGKRSTNSNDVGVLGTQDTQTSTQPRFTEPAEKPDANMALKYTFGVNAWRQWVITKNAELEKQNTPTRKLKLFKTDLLQLTADELNYSLCLFVKEVRKPSGAEYAPDTIYYLCLGIQQYLFENNRIDNIFTDAYYEKFTDCLNDVAKKFTSLHNDALFVVTRVEEEHLWECKQLGAHSPHVLLNTLMYFNTKHFNLVTVEEHMQLSFSHIMKHWKRNSSTQGVQATPKIAGSRNVLLRFYPPQSALEANSKKKKVYEQQENEENPLRCPVKLYEFYLSKCPESVKTRNDVFYLLPERSCVPDSPVWYSTSPLAKEHLIKMLHRILMVKEINVALLSS
ncbi:zinc finger MYM-type protein 3 isoform X2 [Phymastichus coffea]|nr:zinc finger MYM-type protein 3 isoform X2 [Phymastichus coffea]